MICDQIFCDMQVQIFDSYYNFNNFQSSYLKMRLNLPQRGEGHRFDNIQNNDLDQKLTYQQLLNLTHDLSKENLILKSQTRRLGDELRSLHSQFDMKLRDENAELYQAIGVHPILHQYQSTLVPLLDAYQYKIQQFQHQFETVYEEFFALQKKFEEVCKENEDLKLKLTDKIKQLVDVYRNGGNEKMHSDFGQIILDQVNEKQKSLVEENARLERDYQKYKAESERANGELETLEKKFEDSKSKIRELDINLKGLQTENANLKNREFELQIKTNQTEAEKRKLEQAHERAQSQNNQLNKEKDMYKNRLEDLKARIQRDTSIPTDNDQSKFIQQLQTRISFLQAEQGPNDSHKRLTKLQKDYDAIIKEKQRLKQTIDGAKIREDQLNDAITELKGQNSKLSTQVAVYEKNETRVNKSIETLTQKSKNDMIRLKKQSQDDLQKIQFQLKHQIEMKDKKIAELDESLDKLKLQKDRLEKQNSIFGKQVKPSVTKDSERSLNKMKQKMTISEQLFKEQLQIFENDLVYLRKEADASKADSKQKSEELRKIRAQYEDLKKQYEQVCHQKDTLIQQFRRVRNEYEVHLKDKQRLFEQKIREIRAIVQQSDNKRRIQRERVQQVSKSHRNILDDIKNAYEARIRELENQVTQVQYIRTEVTPGR